MRDLIILLIHLITTLLRIPRPGGLRSVVAESVLIKHQLLIVNRSRCRAVLRQNTRQLQVYASRLHPGRFPLLANFTS